MGRGAHGLHLAFYAAPPGRSSGDARAGSAGSIGRRRGNDCMTTLAYRDRQPEVMDQPGLSQESHRSALAALGRINFLSATAGALFAPLARLHGELGARKLRILDVASGGGD